MILSSDSAIIANTNAKLHYIELPNIKAPEQNFKHTLALAQYIIWIKIDTEIKGNLAIHLEIMQT